ncbi:MAG: SpoIIE family protein phosphatase [Bacteroidia bacterium]|nr:SpoIIE family protein phosphatase [Bacteroidia bacterium]MDW8235624.1 SpoIIE family protein phosphatase [Bacteroidia bacterium]
MGLWGTSGGLKSPFPAARWNKQTGKLLSKSEAWDTLPSEAQQKALLMPSWDFLHENGHVWSKYISEADEQHETLFLIPAEGYYEVIQRLSKVEEELHLYREQLHAFVQNAPVPLFLIQKDQSYRITFANRLLLDTAGIPLAQLYKGLTLQDIAGSATSAIQKVLEEAEQHQKPVQEVVWKESEQGTIYWLIRAFPFRTSTLNGIMVSILDITREKLQEEALAQAYHELQAQTEELRQNQEELMAVNEALKEAQEESESRRKELESSLQAAQRYQRTLLMRTHALYEKWGYDYVSVVTRAHTYVGGDFLLVRQTKEYLYVALGDATGHGVSGALLAITIQGLLSQALVVSSPDQIHLALEEVHDQLIQILEVPPDRLSTEGAEVIVVALPLARTGSFYVTSAGRPIYLALPSGEFAEYNQRRRGLGWNLPGKEREPFITETIPYIPQAMLYFFTDGMTDQFDSSGKRIGNRTLLNWIQEAVQLSTDPRTQTRHILQQWNARRGEGGTLTDDATLIALQL